MGDDTALPKLSDAIYPLFEEELLRLPGSGDPLALEGDVISRLHDAARDACARALEALDARLCAGLPEGTRVHDRGSRTMATRLGDVTFRRRTCRDRFGNTVVPLDDAIDLPAGARVSPCAEAELVWLAAGDAYRRAADALARSGGSRVSAACAGACVHRAGEACREDDEARAEALFADGVKPEGERAAEVLCVESDGTVVRLQHEGGARKAEVKAMVAYAGKRHGGRDGGARKVERVRPVSLGCVGTAREMRAQGVAAVGSVYDLSKVGVAHQGFDGAGWCVGGGSYLGFAREVVGHLDPFHVRRAVARCAPRDGRLGWALLEALDAGGAGACAGVMGLLGGAGMLSAGWEAVASYLRAHASEIGVEGPSLGTMEPENQHVYQSRLSAVPCARARRGADSIARMRSRMASGRPVLRLGRERRATPAARARRQRRVDVALADAGPGASQVVQSEGRGWEFPAQASTSGMRADVRYDSGLTADLRLR